MPCRARPFPRPALPEWRCWWRSAATARCEFRTRTVSLTGGELGRWRGWPSRLILCRRHRRGFHRGAARCRPGRPAALRPRHPRQALRARLKTPELVCGDQDLVDQFRVSGLHRAAQLVAQLSADGVEAHAADAEIAQRLVQRPLARSARTAALFLREQRLKRAFEGAE